MTSVWRTHPEAADLAIKRFLDGASPSAVANEVCATFRVSVTRNAVIGLIHRKGIKRFSGSVPKRRRGMPKPAVEARLPATGGVPFIKHRFGQCIYPLWGDGADIDIRDKMVCGDSVVPTGDDEPPCPYCARHAQLCFNGLPGRRRRAA